MLIEPTGPPRRAPAWARGLTLRGQLIGAYLVPASTAAQDAAALERLPLEELMDVDVTSVSRRSEPLSQAAAAADVITGDEIRRSRATTLAEVLRLATGLQGSGVDGSTWAISARGFNATAANKLLVLIDGRSVYSPLFSGVFWDIQNTLLVDVDRIEVIRGPGATLWGANAVNGVINFITRPTSRAAQEGRIEVATGRQARALVSARYGDELGSRGHYSTYAKFKDQAPRRLASGASRVDWSPSDQAQVAIISDGEAGSLGRPGRPATDVHGAVRASF